MSLCVDACSGYEDERDAFADSHRYTRIETTENKSFLMLSLQPGDLGCVNGSKVPSQSAEVGSLFSPFIPPWDLTEGGTEKFQ